MLSLVFGANPRSLSKKKGKKKNMAKKGGGSKKSSSKRTTRRKINPSGIVKKAGKSAVDILVKGLALGAGILGADVVSQNVLPTSVRTSSARNVAKAAVAIGAGLGLSLVPVGIVKKAAPMIAVGGVAKAIYDQGAPEILPKLEFNVLGEAGYLGELDTRYLTLGEFDKRSLQRGGLAGVGEAPVNRIPFGLPG